MIIFPSGLVSTLSGQQPLINLFVIIVINYAIFSMLSTLYNSVTLLKSQNHYFTKEEQKKNDIRDSNKRRNSRKV